MMSLTIDLYENYLYIISIFTFHKSDLFYLILLSNHYIVKKKIYFHQLIFQNEKMKLMKFYSFYDIKNIFI